MQKRRVSYVQKTETNIKCNRGLYCTEKRRISYVKETYIECKSDVYKM